MSTAWCNFTTCDYDSEHGHCPQCAVLQPGTARLCVFHHQIQDEWARANRIFCDLLHRGIEPPPVEFVVSDYEWVVGGGGE